MQEMTPNYQNFPGEHAPAPPKMAARIAPMALECQTLSCNITLLQDKLSGNPQKFSQGLEY